MHDRAPRSVDLFFSDFWFARNPPVFLCHVVISFQHWDQAFGSDGDDFALCSAAGEGEIVIGGYTTGGLYSDNNGKINYLPDEYRHYKNTTLLRMPLVSFCLCRSPTVRLHSGAGVS